MAAGADVLMGRISASARYRRLVSIVPWIAANDGPSIDEVCQRFDVSRENLLADLDVVFMVGLHPYTPDELVDLVIDDERVWITYAPFFERPLRLTPEQALSLVTTSRSLLAVPGAERDGPLARGLDKVAGVLGVDPEAAMEVDLGPAAEDTLEQLTGAANGHRVVEIDYYAYGRDERATRTIEPHRVYTHEGNWYVAAHCRVADGDRIFRIDRIHAATILDEAFEPPGGNQVLDVFEPAPDDPRVTLDVDRSARWVVEQYPVESVEELAGGRLRITLVVTATAWLERLLLRLGADAAVVDGDGQFADLANAAARRVLDRYGENG